MLIGGVVFDYASRIDITRAPDGKPILETPYADYPNPKHLALHRYGVGPFSRLVLQQERVPFKPGVYAVVNDAYQVLYIGMSEENSILTRWRDQYRVIRARNCFIGGTQTTCRINNLIVQTVSRGVVLSLYTHVLEKSKVREIETTLITRIRPPWNLRYLCLTGAIMDSCVDGRRKT
jgi:hypothetical protein